MDLEINKHIIDIIVKPPAITTNIHETPSLELQCTTSDGAHCNRLQALVQTLAIPHCNESVNKNMKEIISHKNIAMNVNGREKSKINDINANPPKAIAMINIENHAFPTLTASHALLLLEQ